MLHTDVNAVLHRCFRCGYCKFPEDRSGYNCPAYERFMLESFAPGGRLWLIKAWLDGEMPPSPSMGEILFSCTMCANCTVQCRFPFGPDIMDMITAARERFLETAGVSVQLKRVLEHIYLHGNPWKKKQKHRGNWAEGMQIPAYKTGDEYLFYVGDIGSYEPIGCRASRALSRILLSAGVSFGILGKEEYSDGMDVLEMGETGLYEELADKNIATFQSRDVSKIICLSPHSFHIMKQGYPKQGGHFHVRHYSQFVLSLIMEGLVKPNGWFPQKVTYHDPCILGRRNGVFDAPRKILAQIPGLRFVEMSRNRESSRCCGGGGGNCFIDTLGGGQDAPARRRVREARDTGADVLAVSCPACLMILDDAVKAERLEDRLHVMDLSEIVAEVSSVHGVQTGRI